MSAFFIALYYFSAWFKKKMHLPFKTEKKYMPKIGNSSGFQQIESGGFDKQHRD